MKKLTFKEFLIEAPIPDDWDNEIYNERISFSKRIAYAKEKAQRIGAGSSRVAFKIPYQGRETVLKIAKNKKGMAQNEFESQILDDYFIEGYKITIPLIDYDKKNSKPTWIQTEFAQKAKPNDFVKECGMSLDELMQYVKYETGKDRYEFANIKQEDIDSLYENRLFDGLVNIIGNYDNIPSGDFERISNWGVYQGNLVIIDMGLSSDVLKQYYS